MRTAGAVYKKLREVKYRHLTDLYRRFLKRTPEFCKYNKIYRIQQDSNVTEIRLCMLHQPPEGGLQPHLLDVCQEVTHCVNCNAFVCVHTKENIKDAFEKGLQNPNLKAKKYPDICALEWVLEQPTAVAPLSFFEKIWFWVKMRLGFRPS